MPNILKYIGYVFLFIFSFFVFVYWTFPYNVLKDRLVSTTEQQLGGEYDLKVGELSPNFFTGAVLKQVKILKHEGDVTSTVWEAAKIKIRASLSTILFGKTNISFSVKGRKGSISGGFKNTDDGFNFDGDFSDFNLGDFGFMKSDAGPSLSSAIDGSLELNINKKQIVQSTGNADFSFNDIKVTAGVLKVSEGMEFNLPELFFSKGSGSTLKFDLSKGAIHVTEMKLQDGDLKLDLTGDVFMSAIFKNYRMNLKGTFSVTPKLEQAIPFLFMIEKQRQADGTYPVTITGRIGQPSIKIGDFTLPI